MMKVGYKVWLDSNGKAFGDGPYALLKRVEKEMSLHKASEQMGMAYSKAWQLIRSMEKRLGFELLERSIGGPSGGGSRITPRAKQLMSRYGRFKKETDKAMEHIYHKHFSSIRLKGEA